MSRKSGLVLKHDQVDLPKWPTLYNWTQIRSGKLD